jgi:TRAP transporter 4TM/12TM fusion protein
MKREMVEAPDNKPEELGATLRTENNLLNKFVFALGIAIALMHIYFNIFTVLPALLQNSLHYAGFALMCALLYPCIRSKTHRMSKYTLALDIMIGLAAAGAAVYLILVEDQIYDRGLTLSPIEWGCGVILILSAIEFTRRTTGWIIPILIVTALTYVGWWGGHIDGVFKFGGLKPETILFRSIYGDDGLFGSIAYISSTFVFMFILFGAFLLRSGGGEFVINIARAVAGKTVGGPGLVAVIASGLTGTISGSAVANTASTGVITIPLMKKAGFPAKFAAGVEASASTGGQLMPPIMGAGAFVMASYTQIPYTTIIAVSVIPAILYFATIAFFVRVEALKNHIKPLEEESLGVLHVLRQGGLPFLLPVGLLVGLLVSGFTPTYAAGVSILGIIASSWVTPNKMGVRAILEALSLGARNMVTTGILLCAVGLIVNVIATTGVGNIFSLMIIEWAGDSLLIAIVLIGLASLVLGMGLPVTAAYIVLGTLSAPALYNLIVDGQIIEMIASGQLSEQSKALLLISVPEKAALFGQVIPIEEARLIWASVPPDIANNLREAILSPETLVYTLLSAHLIIFWLSQDSNVTPPVCLTAFTAAAIAKSPPMSTGVQSWKISKGLYIVPLLFAYTPIIGGTWQEVATIAAFSLCGLYAFTCALQGHMEGPLNWLTRGLTLVSACLLLWPGSVLGHLGGLALLVVIFYISFSRQKERLAHA